MNPNFVREETEWCRMWWSQANEPHLRRILLIGDSITAGYAPHVIAAFKGRYAVDYLASSRSLNDPCFTHELHYMLALNSYDAIHFNNGLHGFHLTTEEYGFHLAAAWHALRSLARDARLAWASSTPVTVVRQSDALDPKKNQIVLSRNAIAADLARRESISIDELYTLVIDRPEIRCDDGYHYLEAGQERLGKGVASFLDQLLSAA
jgi:lysophospholipase L1-like esterase